MFCYLFSASCFVRVTNQSQYSQQDGIHTVSGTHQPSYQLDTGSSFPKAKLSVMLSCPLVFFNCIGQTERSYHVKCIAKAISGWNCTFTAPWFFTEYCLIITDYFIFVVVVVFVVFVVVRLAHLHNINDYLRHFTLLFKSSSYDSFLTLNAVSICQVHQRLASHGPRIVTGPQILVRALCIQNLQLWKFTFFPPFPLTI